MVTIIKICCPESGKRQNDADVDASGGIFAYCKRCKAGQLVELKGKA